MCIGTTTTLLKDARLNLVLGEISPNEFKQFIGKEMRVSQVEYAPKADSQQILTFYMGKNTPERKDYIMENLVVTVEE
ncbi:MAG TPA: hypothetical protein VK530_03390 [Candidatus Acidoferrum sp.]|nr:hypothetical protein [Candidatus Acidoferrum sp.]